MASTEEQKSLSTEDVYNAQERGEQFRKRFPSLRGEFCFLSAIGRSAARESLTALGFTETSSLDGARGSRTRDTMVVLWCSKPMLRRVRKLGKGFFVVNHVAHADQLCNKAKMVQTVRNFETASPELVPSGLEAATFLPDTLLLDGASSDEILQLLRRQRLFIVKPAMEFGGRGIRLFRSDGTAGAAEQFEAFLQQKYSRRRSLVLQKYIEQPLLLNGRKFHLRVFLLLVPVRSGSGLIAFCHHGYAQLACRQYNGDSSDLRLHLTNFSVQKGDRQFQSMRNDTEWLPQQLNDHLNSCRQQLQVPCADWANRKMYPRVRAILAHLCSISSAALASEQFAFQLLGCDFLVDSSFGVWLLEVNQTPMLSACTKRLRHLLPQQTKEAVAVAAEVLQLTHRRQSTKRLVTQQNYRKIFSHKNPHVIRRVFAEAGLQYQGPAAS